MRPLRLDIEGFGTFRDPVTLDFSDTDFFALVGPTGSGKTTVIDAICFALYGSAPRWPRKNQVSLALAPSTSHARVTLVFEVGGKKYAAVRVLARAARGQVSTKQSRLIALPSDISIEGELTDLLDHEFEAHADSPATMDEAVTRILGLTFEHFTQSVVLPQGGFAKFLHAEKRERQDLLVSLLGLSVYEKVAQRANQIAKEAGIRSATQAEELRTYGDATEDAEEISRSRHEELATLEAGLDELLKPWRAAEGARAKATDAMAGFEVSLASLAEVEAPVGLAVLAEDRAAASAGLESAEESEIEADAAVDVVETLAAEAGDAATWKQVIEAHGRLTELRAAETTAAAGAEAATAALGLARTAFQAAEDDLESARTAREQVRVAHQADDLAAQLTAGEGCPVCLQIITEVPDRPVHQGLSEADTRVAATEGAYKAAQKTLDAARLVDQRESDRLARLREDLAAADALVGDQPALETARASYQAAMEAAASLVATNQLARNAREATRKAREALKGVEDSWIRVGRELIQAREGVLLLAPPKPSGDHAADWKSLVAWSQVKADELRAQTGELEMQRALAEAGEAQHREAVLEALRRSGIADPKSFTEVAVSAAVVRAVADTQSALLRVRERRASAQRLTRAIENEKATEVLHKELGQLLSARNFERWMVEEALQAMMVDASATLSELSGGQFELVIDDKQDILVVDHNDASSLRPVQTLSGGETFQASLALALALSSQIAALSPLTGQLDTILLDEGFGTLDASTLDVVASTLEQLSGDGKRTVGVVTHVGALAERVPVQFKVSREGSHSSVEKVWA